MKLIQAILLGAIVVSILSTGCSSSPVIENAKTSATPIDPDMIRYSENTNVPNVSNKNYRRMSRQKLEEESELHAQAGSTWVMEGQGAYLFAQNKTRREGDLLNIRLEGAGQKQVETKVGVIKVLLKQLEEEELKQKTLEAQPAQAPALAATDAAKKPEARAPASAESPKKKEDESVTAEAVPTKIIERMADGNYRIKGQQPIVIGQREYKVLVTGIVRPEDFNEEGISSNKLLDPQFDVVSIRRKEIK